MINLTLCYTPNDEVLNLIPLGLIKIRGSMKSSLCDEDFLPYIMI